MSFSHKRVRDKDGCKEMKGYCRHYKKFWKIDAAQESVAQEPEIASVEHMPNTHHNDMNHGAHNDLSSCAQNKIYG